MLLASPARSADTPTLSVESLAEPWAAPGGPGFVPDFAMGTGAPFAFLGLIAGGVTLRDGLLPDSGPWPGLAEIAPPRAWYDSTATVLGEGAAWRGFGASLVELQSFAQVPVGRRPRAAFTLVNGSSAVDRTGLLLSRGGERSWARGGVLTEQRSGAGLLDRRGQHVWFAELGRRAGAHTFIGSFAQRGVVGGTKLDTRFTGGPGSIPPPFAGFEEASRGEAGSLLWRWSHPGRSLTTTLSRSHDHRESLESAFADFFSERDAQTDAAVVEAAAGDSVRGHGLRLELRQSEVRRSDDFLSLQPRSRRLEQEAWLAARDRRPLAGGTLDLQVGGGHASAPDLRAERWQLSPSLTWRIGPEARRLRLYAERIVTPVWSDLAPGVAPFVQDTWVAGAEGSLGGARQWLRLGVLGAEIGDRASLVRFPVRDVMLRLGWTPEGLRVQDGLATLEAGVRRGAWAAEGSGFARVRPIGTQVAQLDPAVGARGALETGFHAFAGDLGVTLRFETAWVGEFEHVAFPGYFTPPTALAGYATYAGNVALTLGDARIVVRATNLEDTPHPLPWTDISSPFPGTPAAGAGRQFRVELAWPLYN